MRDELPPQLTTPGFRPRRARNWMLLGLLYSFFYMSRYNFSAVTDSLAQVFGWSNTDLGVFASVMPLVYGISVVVNGPIADRIGGKKAFLFGAAGVVVMNFLFGLSHLLMIHPAQYSGGELVGPATFTHGMDKGSIITMLAIVWGLNGYFQSFGALSIVKVNAQWFHIRERGTFAAIFGVLIRMGLIFAFSGTPLILKYFPWYWAFWGPSIFVALLFVLNFLFVKNTPDDAGFDPMDTGDKTADERTQVASLGFVLRKVFASRTMWTIAVASMMIGFVRRSVVDDWFPLYFA
ncbi:MAG: MFS transporter, partial [Deltaproteobacteria bacterium]|nr:MFS transporter [Deltaproteobacteria bacterium]